MKAMGWCLRYLVMVGFVLLFEVVSDGGVCVDACGSQ